MSLEELRQKGETLRSLLVLRWYPLAVKLCKNAEEFPDKVRRPRDFGARWAICQAMTMAATIGWTVGVTPKESVCPASNIWFGWAELEDEMDYIDTWLELGAVQDVAAAKKSMEELWRFKKGEHAGIVFSPLQRTRVVPDLVLIYCDPAQALLLVNGCLYKEGGSIRTSLYGGVACSASIIQTSLTGEPKVTLPDDGCKGLGKVSDNELIFTFPGAMLGDVITGLEKALEKGYTRMPIVPYVTFEPKLIPPFVKLEKKLKIIE